MTGESLVTILSQPLWVFMTVLARISPILMLTPPMTSASVPMRVRAILAIAIALLMTPLTAAGATTIPSDLPHLLIGIGGEVLLGTLFGSVILMAIVSLQLAGQSIGHLAGFDMATAIDPGSNEEMPVISNLLGLLATAFLLLLGGHRQMMECAIESFVRYPAGGVFFETHWLDELQHVLSHTFIVGLRAAAPLAVALLLSNVVTSLLARTLPQLNILSIGFSINVGSMLLVLLISLGSVGWVFQTELAEWINTCHRIIVPDV